MSSENFVQPSIPHFDSHYDHWCMLMENFLKLKEYWQVVSEGIQQLEAGATEARKAMDRSILETILCKDTSKHIWDSMRRKYQGSAKTKRQQLQALRTEFETLKMKSGELITDYFSRVMTIVNKMRLLGDKSDDVAIVEKILRSVTPKFNFVVCAIEESHDIDKLSLDKLQSLLLVHEKKLIQPEQEEQALQVSTPTSRRDKKETK
ncbi:hypothetical protein KY284_020952 [Solanum tuberosum]|nr:hypothetical protein KY284_020952 [Solanum tuberosum]